jgi:hypothetical protein
MAFGCFLGLHIGWEMAGDDEGWMCEVTTVIVAGEYCGIDCNDHALGISGLPAFQLGLLFFWPGTTGAKCFW